MMQAANIGPISSMIVGYFFQRVLCSSNVQYQPLKWLVVPTAAPVCVM
jgi:hypothetical protein